MSAFSVVGFGKYDMPDVRDLPIGQAGKPRGMPEAMLVSPIERLGTAV